MKNEILAQGREHQFEGTVPTPKVNQNMEKLRRIIDRIDRYIGKENFAYIIMVFTQLLWPLSFIYVNEHKVNPIETTMARGIITVVSHSLIMRYFGVSFNIRDRSDLKYLMIRCILLIIHQYTLTVMHFVLSMSVLNSIGTIGPIFVFLIDYQINGVTINKKQLLGIIGGIFGVLLTINGDFIMSLFNSNYQMQSDFQNYMVQDIGLKVAFSFVFVFTVFLWAYSVTIQKKIKGIGGIQISLYIGIYFIFSASIAYNTGIVSPTNWGSFHWVCISALIPTLCQILFITCLNLSKNTGTLTMTIFLGVFTSYMVSFFKYNQKINPFCLFGIALMIYGLGKTIFNKNT